MIIAARAVEGTPVWLCQGGLKSNHQLEWAWLMLLLTGAELASGVSQRVAPDHSSISPIVFHPHFLRARGSNPPPISATIVSNARYRTTSPHFLPDLTSCLSVPSSSIARHRRFP